MYVYWYIPFIINHFVYAADLFREQFEYKVPYIRFDYFSSVQKMALLKLQNNLWIIIYLLITKIIIFQKIDIFNLFFF